MIAKQTDKIEREIVNILKNDTTIADLLFFVGAHQGHASAADMNGRIVNMPVFLNEGEKNSFISVHLDNAIASRAGNIYVSTYKISCGCSHDAWNLPTGETRIYEIANRIEELLSNRKIANSTGNFILTSINNVYWNELTTGVSMLFQVTESDDIDDGSIL